MTGRLKLQGYRPISALRGQYRRILNDHSRLDAAFQLSLAVLLGFFTPWITFFAIRGLAVPVIVAAFAIILHLSGRSIRRLDLLTALNQPAGMLFVVLLIYTGLHVSDMALYHWESIEFLRLVRKPVFLVLALFVLAYASVTPGGPYRDAIKTLFGYGIALYVLIFSFEILKNPLILWSADWIWNDTLRYLMLPVLQMNRSLEVFSTLMFLVALVIVNDKSKLAVHLLFFWTLFVSLVDIGVYEFKGLHFAHIHSESVQVGLVVAYFIYLLSGVRAKITTNIVFAAIIGLLLFSPLVFKALPQVIEFSGLHLPTPFIVRFEVWAAAASSAFHDPLFGSGIDSARYFDFYLQYGLEHIHPHNMFLQLWMDLGLVGVVLVGGLVISGWRMVQKTAIETRPAINATVTMLSLLAMTTHSLWQTWFMSLILLVITLIWILADSATNRLLPQQSE